MLEKKYIPILILLLCLSCKKQAADPLNNIPKIAGDHKWVGVEYYHGVNGLNDTQAYSEDYAITVLSNKLFVIPHSSLFGPIVSSADTFTFLNQKVDTLTFTSHYTTVNGPYEEDTIKYDFINNIIYWFREDISKYSTKTYDLHTP